LWIIYEKFKKHGVSIGEQFHCCGENLGMSLEQQHQLWSSFPLEIEKAMIK
jgi:hypothetical protein